MDKLNAMATFVQIVDGGSLTAAADAFNTSLPTIVRTLASLEECLSVRLLNRTTRRISLTDEGRIYLEHCREILANIDDAELALSSQQTNPKGTLQITAPVLFGKIHVLPNINDFLSLYSDVSVKLLLFDRNVNLIEEGIDVAIRIGQLEDSSMIAIPVGEVRKVICASLSLLDKIGTPNHPSDLNNQPAVRATPLSPSSKWHFYEPVKSGKRKRITVSLSERLVCNQVAASLDACIAGIGFGMFLSYQVSSLIKQGILRTVLDDYVNEPIPVNILYTGRKLMSTKVRKIVDHLTLALREELTNEKSIL